MIDESPSDNLSLGASQTGGRIYNERLILSLVRHEEGLPKAEIAKLTGLSAQTVSVIMQQLEADHLVIKGTPKRGKVGQPLTPFSLNPEGVYFLGLKIGRSRSELALMDFVGNIVSKQTLNYNYPATNALSAFVSTHTPKLIHSLDTQLQQRVIGLGIATPFELWSWTDEMGAPLNVMASWKGFDVKHEMRQASNFPTFILNDATAACAAELTFGNKDRQDNFLYIHIGYFIGGGIVLNGNLFSGPSGNAGALAALPIRRQHPENRDQLVHDTSKISLQRLLEAEGIDASIIWDTQADWSILGDTLEVWLNTLAENLAYAIISATAIIDFPAVIIDGDLPSNIRQCIIQRVTAAMQTMNRQGLSPVTILQGSLGSDARLIGGASLPLLANFSRDRNVAFGG